MLFIFTNVIHKHICEYKIGAIGKLVNWRYCKFKAKQARRKAADELTANREFVMGMIDEKDN